MARSSMKLVINPSKKSVPEGQSEVTVTALIHQANATIATMSNNNPTKHLIFNLAYALKQLTDRLEAYEKPKEG